MAEAHAFKIRPDNLPAFLDKVNCGDSMGGNKITFIKDCGDYILVTISREHSYPFVINELREAANA